MEVMSQTILKMFVNFKNMIRLHSDGRLMNTLRLYETFYIYCGIELARLLVLRWLLSVKLATAAT